MIYLLKRNALPCVCLVIIGWFFTADHQFCAIWPACWLLGASLAEIRGGR